MKTQKSRINLQFLRKVLVMLRGNGCVAVLFVVKIIFFHGQRSLDTQKYFAFTYFQKHRSLEQTCKY